MPDLTIVAHNIHAGAGKGGRQKAHRFLNMLEDEGADVGVVTEAKTAVDTFRRCGMTVLAEDPKPRKAGLPLPEQGNTVVIVEPKRVRRSWVAVQKLRWVVRRYNRWHDPRRDQIAMLKGRVRGVWAAHLPPGGPNSVNGAAWREQMDAALKWADGRRCRVIVGDLNANAATVRDYAKKAGVRCEVVGRGVDLIVVVNGTATFRSLGRNGSDHHALTYDITANQTRIRRLLRRP